jgi:hypothetical protein
MLAVLLSLGVGYALAQAPQGKAGKYVDKSSPELMKAAPEKTPQPKSNQRGIAVSDPGMPEEINTPVKKPKGK